MAEKTDNSPGVADRMGQNLKALVEKQLLDDLKFYKIDQPGLIFDWSGSSVEEHKADYLDGTVYNFSGIVVLDHAGKIVADGWMDFILEPDFFIVYWDYITTREGKKKLAEKQMPGIPKQVWKQLPEDLKRKYNKQRLKG